MSHPEHESTPPELDARARRRHRRQRWLLRSVPLVRFLVRAIWATLRVERVGMERAIALVDQKQPFIPCYWHQKQFVCVKTMLELQKRGLKTGFLVSPSRDGEIAARLLGSLDVQILRGSATRTGAQAMRDLFRAITVDGLSPIMTPDGPKGPIHVFKPGTIIMAKLSGVPIVPMNFAAKRAWEIGSWDRFQLPKPFTRVVVAVGEPRFIPKSTPESEIEPICREMEATLAELEKVAQEKL